MVFSEPVGQGWTQVLELLVAFVLALLIGIERESHQRSAGIRTYTLVGLGSALFVLISKYGFTDVLGEHVILDPSRVAAQIVSGLGFIGAGLIFVRRDAVRGLTTAASVWLVAAVGAAAGAGLPVLAALTTALYFVIIYALRPLQRLVRGHGDGSVELRVSYIDGRGLLREIINLATSRGFAIENLTTEHLTGAPGREPETGHGGAHRRHDDRKGERIDDLPTTGPEEPRGERSIDERGEHQRPGVVVVMLVLTGTADAADLVAGLDDLDGVVNVETNPDRDL